MEHITINQQPVCHYCNHPLRLGETSQSLQPMCEVVIRSGWICDFCGAVVHGGIDVPVNQGFEVRL